jgi:hypothetical protein
VTDVVLHTAEFHLRLGDVPTWVGAILAGVAGVAAFRVYLIESRRDQQTEKERRAREDDVRRAQAMRVVAWFGPNPRRDGLNLTF